MCQRRTFWKRSSSKNCDVAIITWLKSTLPGCTQAFLSLVINWRVFDFLGCNADGFKCVIVEVLRKFAFDVWCGSVFKIEKMILSCAIQQMKIIFECEHFHIYLKIVQSRKNMVTCRIMTQNSLGFLANFSKMVLISFAAEIWVVTPRRAAPTAKETRFGSQINQVSYIAAIFAPVLPVFFFKARQWRGYR